MDLLGSIMSSMDKPPSIISKEEREARKERKKQFEKSKMIENKKMQDFKNQMKTRIEAFMKNVEKKLVLETMTRVQRALVHEIAEDAGLTALSFGVEELDRHIILWKKEYAPCDDEVAVLQLGEEWTEERALEIKLKRDNMNSSVKGQGSRTIETAPKRDYHKKYDHIISLDVGKGAAKDVTANTQYGNVRIENKTDKRTIEETLAERRSKKMKIDSSTDDVSAATSGASKIPAQTDDPETSS